jgi:hypothetical protein
MESSGVELNPPMMILYFGCQFLIETLIGIFFSLLDSYGQGMQHHGIAYATTDEKKHFSALHITYLWCPRLLKMEHHDEFYIHKVSSKYYINVFMHLC